ncbi:hypothetical protein [Novosphingobium sp. PY1]|uniref:hypothetical protein n=1 Tax=Novosphingobium sp. PY1 TaxID=1882221 RepID=UPI001A909CD4|nr:hypothetical protein [Novosphingobium sp. PY1]GFM27191.1 elongation factor G [Novosphingobium sp. PY1]
MEVTEIIKPYTEVKCILTKQQMTTFYGKMPAHQGNVSVIEAALPNRTLLMAHLDSDIDEHSLKYKCPDGFAQRLTYTSERVHIRIYDPSFNEIYDDVVDAVEWSDLVAAAILGLHGYKH